MKRAPAWLATLALGACGGQDEPSASPPLPFNKVAPTLPRLVRQRRLEEWLERTSSPVAERRAEAASALVELLTQPDVLAPVLERLLADPDASVRYAAVVAVGRFPGDLGPTATVRVAALLGAREAGLAAAVRATLRTLGPRAVPALERLVAGGLPESSAQAAELLAVIRAGDAPPR